MARPPRLARMAGGECGFEKGIEQGMEHRVKRDGDERLEVGGRKSEIRSQMTDGRIQLAAGSDVISYLLFGSFVPVSFEL